MGKKCNKTDVTLKQGANPVIDPFALTQAKANSEQLISLTITETREI